MLCEKEQCCRKLISHLEKPLTLPTQIAVGYFSWCQAKTGQITVLWPLLRSTSINTTWFPGWQIHLCHRDMYYPVCQKLSHAYWCEGWGKKRWGGRERAGISILASAMEKWHNSIVFAHYCHVRLASPLCLCVLFLHRRSTDLTAAIVETSILCLTAGLPKTLGKHRKYKAPKCIPTVFGGLPWQHIVDLPESLSVC